MIDEIRPYAVEKLFPAKLAPIGMKTLSSPTSAGTSRRLESAAASIDRNRTLLDKLRHHGRDLGDVADPVKPNGICPESGHH